jgi:hypothetical protein
LCFPTAEAKFRFSLFFLYYFLRSFFFFLFLRSILPENINLDFLGKSTARWTQVWFPSQIFLQCFLRLIATVLFFLFLVSAHAVFSFLFCIFSRSRVLAFLISEWTDIYYFIYWKSMIVSLIVGEEYFVHEMWKMAKIYISMW